MRFLSPKLHNQIVLLAYRVWRSVPEHFQLQLSCGAGIQAFSLWRHIQDEEVHFPQCPGLPCFQEKPEAEISGKIRDFHWTYTISQIRGKKDEFVGSKYHLNHPRMITRIIPGPWCSILHGPPIFWRLLSFCHQSIDAHFELFIIPLLTELRWLTSELRKKILKNQDYPINRPLRK